MNALKERYFSNKAQELNAHIDLGENFGDQARVKAANEVRSAIIAAGRSESSIGHISSAESGQTNGQTTIASYEHHGRKTNLVDLDTLMQLSASIGQSVGQTTKEALDHEKEHEKADLVEGADELNAAIAFILGKEAVGDIEETNASVGTTEKWDGYKEKRRNAVNHAGKMRIGLYTLLQFKKEGDAEGFIEAANDAGLIQNESANSRDYGVANLGNYGLAEAS